MDEPLTPEELEAMRLEAGIEPPTAKPDSIAEFVVEGESIALADKALLALAISQPATIFQRGRMLVRVVGNGIPPRKIHSTHEIPLIDPVSDTILRDTLARIGDWKQWRRKTWEEILPPMWLVKSLLSRASWSRLLGGNEIPMLHGVVESPVLRPDGTILTQPGFDRASGLFFHHPNRTVQYPAIPANPTLADAQKAATLLLDPLQDFPFKNPNDQSAAIAAILSLIGRHGIDGCVPMFVIRSPSPGNGKSLLADVISIIGTGRPAPRVSPDDDNSEQRKLILSIALSGMSTVLMDNLTGRIGSKSLAAALTSETWQDRLLGESRMVEAPLKCVWVATGNNLSFKGDLGRRIVICDIDSGLEHPEDRPEQSFKHPDLIAHVSENRPGFVSAAITILKAYQDAQKPKHGLPRKGSFEAWDDLVRGACVWVGIGDPDAGKERVREDDDSELTSLRQVLEEVYKATLGDSFTAASLIAKADSDDDLKDALCEWTNRDKLERSRIGYALRNNRDRIVNGMAFYKQKQTTKRVALSWKVKKSDEML